MKSPQIVTNEQKAQFKSEGYCVIENVIDPDILTMLREECAYFLGYIDATMDERETVTIGISHKGKRYFIANRYKQSNRLHNFLFGKLMAEITQTPLGHEVFLFNEQWVIKGAEQGMKFSWHQDSGYVKFRDPDLKHKPYLSCWCTLDDVNISNGTIYILPHSRGNTRNLVHSHTKETVTNDLVGYQGNDPGIPIIAPAGSIVAFTSYNFHRSNPNSTNHMRRIYLAQYTSEEIRQNSGELWALAVPFISSGKSIYTTKKNKTI